MIKINLLAWREAGRARHKLAFKRALILFGVVTLVLWVIIYFFSSSQSFGSYEAGQKLLSSEINQVAAQVSKLQKNLKVKSEAQKKINALYALNYQRYQIVRFFNALTELVPKGIFLNKVIRRNNEVIVTGESSSNALISTFMKNIQSRPVVNNPVLTEAKTPDENVADVIRFQIRFTIVDKAPTVGKKQDGK